MAATVQDSHREIDRIDPAVARTIHLGRQVTGEVMRLSPGSDASEAARLRRCVAALDDGTPFREVDEGGLLHLRDRLVALCREQEVERRRVFRGFHDPEYGDVGTVEEVPVYTGRGLDLVRLLGLLEAFLAARVVAQELMSRL